MTAANALDTNAPLAGLTTTALDANAPLTGPGSLANLAAMNCAAFLWKTFQLVSDPETDDILSWSPSGESFVVHDQERMVSEVLPKVFKHSNFQSFVRQCHNYGFRKLSVAKMEFGVEGFQRGRPELLMTLKRQKSRSGVPSAGASTRPRRAAAKTRTAFTDDLTTDEHDEGDDEYMPGEAAAATAANTAAGNRKRKAQEQAATNATALVVTTLNDENNNNNVDSATSSETAQLARTVSLLRHQVAQLQERLERQEAAEAQRRSEEERQRLQIIQTQTMQQQLQQQMLDFIKRTIGNHSSGYSGPSPKRARTLYVTNGEGGFAGAGDAVNASGEAGGVGGSGGVLIRQLSSTFPTPFAVPSPQEVPHAVTALPDAFPPAAASPAAAFEHAMNVVVPAPAPAPVLTSNLSLGSIPSIRSSGEPGIVEHAPSVERSLSGMSWLEEFAENNDDNAEIAP
mmetsp:Transcript_13253/g.43680  ORF Transcript_13253/g.43680 Transcript_13253/m.43680 type:complete len:456 (+) Transcript_13253:72-1439(+)|eukprot:CAMPEP_0170148040 /NCGR_PEP_ID=MMETSP0033_2-20121228/37082_1 /TAXON_ID=195969 /ORGANISM="Dolichomastix tenuilepis, Strain CCMP3274" /LENGTH=455 /DNA_ID=CAMNT_0010384897 /DNA_START=39 /DNA_END=1406 /DNA_ORIENTATION=+